MTGTSSSLSRHSQQQQQQHTQQQQQQNQQSQSSQSNTASQRLEKLSLHVMRGEAPVFFPDAVPQAPEDPLFGLMAEYRKDTSPKKVDLGIGAYRDDTAKPWVLPVVKKADEVLRNTPDLNHEYLPIGGLADFTNAAQRLILGENSPVIKDNRVVSVQTISGTGAVHLGGLFLSRFHPRSPKPAFYVSIPTWANHNQIFKNIGARIADYPYFNVDTRGLDYNRLIGAILTAPHFSVFVFHACAHNPTGVDPTKEQWVEIAKAMRASNHFPFFDCAYQGFASGDLDNDAWAIRHFAEEGFEFAVAQSFAKNLGLYGERVGALHFISSPGPTAVDTTNRVRSQLNVLQRSEISNPPAYGARIASTILNDKALFTEWEENLRTMSGRIIDMRKALRQLLEEKGTPGTWNHITDQIGMFSFTGLTELQVYILKDKWHIYMTKNGRISMAGLNTNNIEYFATAVDAVVRETRES